MGGTCCVRGREEDRNAYRVLARNPEEMVMFEDLRLPKMKVLKQILKKQGGMKWAGFIWLRIHKWLVMNFWIH